MKHPKEPTCFDDAPTNNGWGNNKDWDEIRPRYWGDDEEEEEEEEPDLGEKILDY